MRSWFLYSVLKNNKALYFHLTEAQGFVYG